MSLRISIHFIWILAIATFAFLFYREFIRSFFQGRANSILNTLLTFSWLFVVGWIVIYWIQL